METKNEKALQKPKPIVNCEEIIHDGENEKCVKVEYDLAPVVDFIELGGIDYLISVLKEIQFHYSTLALSAYENDRGGDVDSEIPKHLFLLKMMAECFEIVRNGSYEIKSWPVINGPIKTEALN